MRARVVVKTAMASPITCDAQHCRLTTTPERSSKPSESCESSSTESSSPHVAERRRSMGLNLLSDDVDLLIAAASCALVNVVVAHLRVPNSLEPVLGDDEFDERRGVQDKTEDTPCTLGQVYCFLRCCMKRADLSPALLAIVVVVFRRLPAYVALTAHNWRVLLLLCVLLAQKVAMDIPLASSQFSEMWRFATTADADPCTLPATRVIRMELALLARMHFDVNVKAHDWRACHRELCAIVASRAATVE